MAAPGNGGFGNGGFGQGGEVVMQRLILAFNRAST